GVLRLGTSNNTGDIDIAGPVTAHAGYSTLDLISKARVWAANGVSLAVTSLAGEAGDRVGLEPPANAGANRAGGAGGWVRFASSGALTVTTVDGVSGVTTQDQLIILAAGPAHTLTVSQAIAAGSAAVALSADDMNLSAAVSAGTAAVQLAPVTAA